MNALTKLTDRLKRADPAWRAVIDAGLFNMTGPAVIRGQWFYVDPWNGKNSNDGASGATPLADLLTAYNKCSDGGGDGIVLLSAGTGTSSQTTSYLKSLLLWAKSGITVVGIAAPTWMAGRARVANKDVVTTSATIVTSDTAHTMTRSDAAGSFIADGWVAGMTGVVTAGNDINATFTLTNVTATVLTFTETLTVQVSETVSLASYCDHLIEVSGSNNAFYNVDFANFGANVLAIGGVIVSGLRNYFSGCNIVGSGGTLAAAAAGIYDLLLNHAQENTFEFCTFGTDTALRSAATCANLRFTGTSAGVTNFRNKFVNCDFVSQSVTVTRGFVHSASAVSFQGVQIFTRCRFMNWQDNGIGTNLTSLFIGTKPTAGQLFFEQCSTVGVAAWDSVANKTAWVANSAVSAPTGGIGVAI